MTLAIHGPDYTFGFGLINGLRAVQVMEENRYVKGAITTGENHTHTIEVPAGTKQVRAMLYWHDKEAPAFPAKALINDLDIRLTDPNNAEYLPWVLNTAPTQVADDAVRGVDTLNNIEQISIEDPVAGTYTITIDGKSIPFGPQEYYILYEFIDASVTVTHLMGVNL